MKAVVVRDTGIVEIKDIIEPEPAYDEIKVKIAYAGICGSDSERIAGVKDKPERPKGAIGWFKEPIRMSNGIKKMGHEGSGTIVKIGKDVRGNFQIGQNVAMNFIGTCGACYHCANGMPHFCERPSIFDGLMAEYAVFKEELVFPLPDNLPLDVGAFLEPLSVVVHAFDIAKIKVGDSVIITGGGTIGLLMLELAIKSGAAKVLVSEPIAEKRKMAKRLGADVVVNPLKENILDKSNKLTDGRGFNVCIEATGIPSIASQLILLAGDCGTIVWAATYPKGIKIPVPINYMFSKELSIHSVKLAPYSFSRALQMLPKLDLKPLITVYPLEEVVKAYEVHKTGKGIKILIQP